MKPLSKKQRKAFTLVEVMLAVGVIALALTSMIGLLGAIVSNLNNIRYQDKAITLLANLETTLRMQSFDKVFKWVANPATPHVVYFWDEFQSEDDPDNTSVITKSSELPGHTSGVPPTDDDLKNSTGEVFRANITLYQSALKGVHTSISSPDSVFSGGGLTGEPDDYALSYIPRSVEFFVEPRDDITNGPGDAEVNDQRRVYDAITTKMR